jgi:hypothetical protein
LFGSSLNVAFTKHITNALKKIRDEKLKQKASVPKKLEDGWEPIIDMHVNGFDCHALCDTSGKRLIDRCFTSGAHYSICSTSI